MKSKQKPPFSRALKRMPQSFQVSFEQPLGERTGLFAFSKFSNEHKRFASSRPTRRATAEGRLIRSPVQNCRRERDEEEGAKSSQGSLRFWLRIIASLVTQNRLQSAHSDTEEKEQNHSNIYVSEESQVRSNKRQFAVKQNLHSANTSGGNNPKQSHPRRRRNPE